MATKEKKISLGLKRYEIVGFGQERVWKNHPVGRSILWVVLLPKVSLGRATTRGAAGGPHTTRLISDCSM